MNPPRPNILIFMTDQQRGGTVLPEHCAKTPVLNRFRQQSVAFSNAFCPSPHCCPSRASFMTGLYPSEHGVWNNVCVQNALSTGLNDGVRCWSEDLADAGYQLDWNGKWHVSWDEGPEKRGFSIHSLEAGARYQGQDVMGMDWSGYQKEAEEAADLQPERAEAQVLRPGWGSYTHYGIDENPFGDQEHVNSAIDVLNARSGETSWCHYIGLLGPHDPYKVPKRFLDLYDAESIELPPSFNDRMEDKPALYRRTRDRFDQLDEAEHREAIRHYYAFCSYEDYLFGQVLDALEKSGQADNTVVIYCSDHGDYLGDHGLWCKGLPCFRGAYEVPLMIRWPGHIHDPGRKEESFVSLTDIAPTLLEMAGIKPERSFSGESLMPFLRNEAPVGWRDAIFTQSNGNELYGIQRSVVTDDWKLVYNGFDYDELYDLKNDPHEMKNLAKDPQHADVKRRLYQRLWRFASEHGEQSINAYIMTGLAEYGPMEAFRHFS